MRKKIPSCGNSALERIWFFAIVATFLAFSSHFGCFEYNSISYFSSPSRAAVPKARNRISAPSDRDDQVTRTHQTKVVDRLGPKGLYQV